MLLALLIPWNDDIATHVPTSLDAGGAMRVRQSNGWYRVEVREPAGWRPHLTTRRWDKVTRLVDEYTG